MKSDMRTLNSRIAMTREKLERLELERVELVRAAGRRGIPVDEIAEASGLTSAAVRRILRARA